MPLNIAKARRNELIHNLGALYMRIPLSNIPSLDFSLEVLYN